MGASPADAARVVRLTAEVDVRQVLPTIRVPTLILHAKGDAMIDVRYSRYMAERISGAKYVELPSSDHLPWLADADMVADEVAEFLTGVRPVHEPDRVLATVLFTDIVNATAKAPAWATVAGLNFCTSITPRFGATSFASRARDQHYRRRLLRRLRRTGARRPMRLRRRGCTPAPRA